MGVSWPSYLYDENPCIFLPLFTVRECHWYWRSVKHFIWVCPPSITVSRWQWIYGSKRGTGSCWVSLILYTHYVMTSWHGIAFRNTGPLWGEASVPGASIFYSSLSSINYWINSLVALHFVTGIYWWPVNSPEKGLVLHTAFPCHWIMICPHGDDIGATLFIMPCVFSFNFISSVIIWPFFRLDYW